MNGRPSSRCCRTSRAACHGSTTRVSSTASFGSLRSGAPWRDLPDEFGPYTTCYNRFVRWRRAGVWAKIMSALAGAHDVAVQMIDTSIVRVHQHGSCVTRNRRQSMGRSRGGLTCKIHALVDASGLPVRLAVTPGEAHDNRLAGKPLVSTEGGIDRDPILRSASRADHGARQPISGTNGRCHFRSNPRDRWCARE